MQSGQQEKLTPAQAAEKIGAAIQKRGSGAVIKE